jgi:hypothetical protein
MFWGCRVILGCPNHLLFDQQTDGAIQAVHPIKDQTIDTIAWSGFDQWLGPKIGSSATRRSSLHHQQQISKENSAQHQSRGLILDRELVRQVQHFIIACSIPRRRKPGQNKKHKTWDGDAFVSNVSGKLSMITEEGKVMGTTPWKGDPLHGGYHVYIGGKEVELDCEVTLEDLPSIAGGHADEKPAPAIQNPASIASDSIGSPATKSFVAPTSFYGPQAPSKPKLKGPL